MVMVKLRKKGCGKSLRIDSGAQVASTRSYKKLNSAFTNTFSQIFRFKFLKNENKLANSKVESKVQRFCENYCLKILQDFKKSPIRTLKNSTNIFP